MPSLPAVAQARAATPHIDRVSLGRNSLRSLERAAHLRDIGSAASASRDDSSLDVFTTGEISADAFTGTALTWSGDAPSSFTLLVRTRNRDGSGWSPWSKLVDDDHGPEPGSAEARNARSGTDFLIAGDADAIEVRVETPDGRLPDDLGIELIDPGTSDVDAAAGRDATTGNFTAAAPRPNIRARADWGADESMRTGSIDYGAIRGAFVHHTAGSNGYSQSAVPGIIRSIYAYHVNGRGWKDIGYNFLVDRFGRIWHGRAGSGFRSVIGAHTLNYNQHSFGASLLGTYTNTNPSDASLTAFAQLIAWKFTIHNINPNRVTYPPGVANQPAIAGHRDAGSTECPGGRLYSRLSTIRGRVANRM